MPMRRLFAYCRRRPFLCALFLVAPAAIVAVLLTRIPLSDVAAASADANPHMLLVSAGFMFGTGVMNSLVLHRALTAGAVAARYERTYVVQAASHGLASCAPATAVDAFRVWMLRGDAPVGRVVGAVASQKVIEGAAALCVVAAAGPFLQLPSGAQILRWAPLVSLCALAALIAVLTATPLGARLARAVPDGRFGRLVVQIAAGARALGQVRALVPIVAAQATALACRVGALWALLAAFGITRALMGALLVFVLLMVASTLPSIGGVGAREAALLPALSLVFGVSAADALAFSLWIQTMGVVTAAAMIVPYVIYRAARACVPFQEAEATR